MENVSREKEILRKKKKCYRLKALLLEIKNLKKPFDGPITKLDTAEERMFQLENLLRETSKIEKQREYRLRGKKKVVQGLWASHKRYIIHVVEIPQRQKREKETREIVEIIMTENFLKLILNTKLHPGSSENSKKDNTKKFKKNPHLHLGISFSNYRK